MDPKKPIVILISGFGGNARSLGVMRKRFLRDGFNVLIISLSWHVLYDSVRGFYFLSEKLSSLVLELRKQRGLQHQRIFLVAHSAGGLVARHYVQLLGGEHYCDGLVTLATPHQGTWIALLGFLTHLILMARCLYQILPFSNFIQQINRGAFPKSFPMLSMHSDSDTLCPESATLLPDPIISSGQAEILRLQGLAHIDFLLNKKVYLQIRKWLGKHGVPYVEGGPVAQSESLLSGT